MRQGSALSPLLFVVVMEEVIEKEIGKEKMKFMIFRDDLMGVKGK